MSFLKQLRVSLENEEIEPVEVTPEAEAEVEVAAAEEEIVRREIEADLEQVERAEAVVNEIEGTNEALVGVAQTSEDGSISAPVAAMVEAQRRTAAAALGLDPDEGAGEELVDAAGLESLVEGQISVEEAVKKGEGMLKKVKEFILGIIKSIGEKIKAVAKWISKRTNILTGVTKKVYAGLKSLSDEDFNKAKEALKADNDLDKYGILIEEYKDPQGVLMKVVKSFKGITLTAIDQIKLVSAIMKDPEMLKDETLKKYNFIMDKNYDKIMSALNSMDGNGYDGFFKKMTVSSTPSTPILINFDEKEAKFDASKLDKKKLLDCINSGILNSIAGNVLDEDNKKADGFLKEIANVKNELPAGHEKELSVKARQVTTAYARIGSAKMSLVSDTLAAITGYLQIGKAILAAAGKSAAKEEAK